MSDYYDRSGKPVSSDVYGYLHSAEVDGKPYMRIAETFVEGIRVSTVWLGSNHRYGDGPPLIFETLVFGGGLDQDGDRYSTEAGALAGHKAIVERVRHEADIFRSVVADPKVREAVLALRDAQQAYREVVGGYGDVAADFGRIISAVEAGLVQS